MTILQSLFLFAFFCSSTACFSAEPLEPSVPSTPRGAALVKISQQLREDLREVTALCGMRFSLNKALLATSDDVGYRLGVENDMAFYIKANRILQLIHTNPLEIAGSIDRLNKKSIDILYREVSKYVHSRTEQERTERIAYKKLLQERKKERGRDAIMTSSEEILNELPVLRQIKEILGRHASKYEVEMPRFFESDVACTGVNINRNKIIRELEIASNSFFLVLGIDKSSVELRRSKPSIGLRDRLAFEKAHPRFSSAGGITFPETPPSQESKADALIESVKLLCVVKDFIDDRTLKEILGKKGTVLGVVEAEDVQKDVLSVLLEKVESFSTVVDGVNFKAAALDKDVHKYFVEKLEVIKLGNKFFTNKISQMIAALERKELAPAAAPVEEALGVAEVLSSPVVSPAPQAEAPAPRPVKEKPELLLPPASESEKKERKESYKAKEKKAEKELQPLGSQERSPVDDEGCKAWKTKMCDMVQGLRQSWKSNNFKDIQRAVHQLGGTIEPNGKDSHYIIRLAHIETGEPVLGATLKRKAKGGQYPWWLDTAVDTLERATGLVTNNMSRVFEKVHSK